VAASFPLPLSDFVDAARGVAPADLVFRNARVVNVLTGEIHEETVGSRDRILGFGDYGGAQGGRDGPPRCLSGPGALGRAPPHRVHDDDAGDVRPSRGRPRDGAVITDPHEIANVRGVDGIRAFQQASDGLPLDVFIMLPSCVPRPISRPPGRAGRRISSRCTPSRACAASPR